MKVGILGLGTVGGGVVNVLQKNSESIERRTGVKIEVVLAGVRDVKQKRICDTSTIKLTIDPFFVFMANCLHTENNDVKLISKYSETFSNGIV